MTTNTYDYDVIIMGGGPGGATLGALLKRKARHLSVAIFEKSTFPRDHIGESFAHPLIPVLEDAGSLAKILASDCWVKKYGGIFNWDVSGPSITFFDHINWVRDGVHRWAMHVDRADFDKILLDHARDEGVTVFENTTVAQFESNEEVCTVTLADGERVKGRVFVDASGRQNSILTANKRKWLSEYKNIAIWNHYTGCLPAQSLKGDWNVFTADNLSPIGCFAFEHGWCWFIPVPKKIDGKRVVTHSIGIVTNPTVIKHTKLTDADVFLAAIKQVPLLKELVQDAKALNDNMLTATNYSMINERFCDFDERWMLVGDSSYFVDPLFSSGVAFACAQASAATLAIMTRLSNDVEVEHQRAMWADYDRDWHAMAESYSLSIDQWYHHIAQSHPQSTYWRSRGTSLELDIREQTFQALIDTAITPDLLQVMTYGSRDIDDLDNEGAFMSARRIALGGKLPDDVIIELAPDVVCESSYALDIPGFKAFRPPPPFDLSDEVNQAIAQYWRDPVAHGEAVPAPHDAPLPCDRFVFRGREDQAEVRSIAMRDNGRAVYEILQKGAISYGKICAQLSVIQIGLLTKLIHAGMVLVRRVPAQQAVANAQEANPS